VNTSNSIIQEIRFPISENESFCFEVKRDDLIDPIVSGNKWRKLEYNLLKVEELNKTGIITFGGAFSNHLVATAKAAQLGGVPSVGVVRGDELTSDSNPTLKACTNYGMELVFVSRAAYSGQCESTYMNDLLMRFPGHYIVPEGGKNYYGMIGCQHILKETDNDYDHVYLAGGTGTTGAGVLVSSKGKTKVHVISSLKGDFLYKDIQEMLILALFDEEIVGDFMERLEVVSDNYFGGYGKVNEELITFINDVFHQTHLKLDPIYTSKAFFNMISDYKSGKIKSTDKVLFIHTGGLQGAEVWKGKIDWV